MDSQGQEQPGEGSSCRPGDRQGPDWQRVGGGQLPDPTGQPEFVPGKVTSKVEGSRLFEPGKSWRPGA